MTSACLLCSNCLGDVFTANFRRGTNGLLCSGHGECVCNQCMCEVCINNVCCVCV